MPTVLTGVAGHSATVNGPSAGEVATSAAMRASLQTLIDNDAYAYSLIGTGGTGVKKISSLAGTVLIKAATGYANGELVFDSTNDRLYRRDTGAAGADNDVWYLDHNTEAGGWKLVRAPNAIIDENATTAVAAATTTSSTYSDVAGASIGVLNGLTGDVLHAWCMVKNTAHASSAANFRLRFVDGAAVSNVFGPTSIAQAAGTGLGFNYVGFRFVLTADGGGTLYAQHGSSDNVNTITTEVMCLSFVLKRA